MILSNIPSYPLPFAVRNLLTNQFYQKKSRFLDILKKKEKVTSLNRDIQPGDSWPYVECSWSWSTHLMRGSSHSALFPSLVTRLFCIILFMSNSISLNNILKKKKRKHPQLHPFPLLQQELTSKRTFSKKINMSTLYFSYATLMTHVLFFGGRALPVSALGNFQRFLLKLVQTGFCSSSK